jgi:heat shock protein HslJ
MRTRWAAAVLVVVGVIGLAGCSSGSSSGGTSTTPPGGGLTGTTWKLTSYRAATGSAVAAVPDATADLAFQAHGVLAGSTGCNSFGGSYTTSGTALTIVPGPMTLIGCPDALAAQEAALVALFPKVIGYSLASDRLALTGVGATTLLTYAAGPAGLTGTSWIATGVHNGQSGLEATGATSDLTATFAADGVFHGFGGCNTLSGRYTTTGSGGLTITDVASTLKACTPEVTALEQRYTAALAHVTAYALSGGRLTLRDRGGQTQVTYRLEG